MVLVRACRATDYPMALELLSLVSTSLREDQVLLGLRKVSHFSLVSSGTRLGKPACCRS